MKKFEKLFREAIRSATCAEAIKITRIEGYADGYVHVRWRERDWMPLGPVDVLEDVLTDLDYDWGYVDYRRTTEAVAWLTHRYPSRAWEVTDFPAVKAQRVERPVVEEDLDALIEGYFDANPEYRTKIADLCSASAAGADVSTIVTLVEESARVPRWGKPRAPMDDHDLVSRALKGQWIVSWGREGYEVERVRTTRVFLGDENAILAVGCGWDRHDAVRAALDKMQSVAGTNWDLSGFRTCDVFPAWQINPYAFLAHENVDSDTPDDALLGVVEAHPASGQFLVLIDSDFEKRPCAA
ncbi:hypothetical protein [Rhizobium leguminosarum]|uniref:hypothetical protein n=1 Tax=Rhizobium leguminosarum TaxID=384 RepID=UPI0014420CCA|nr:hypothetical protein [Rhizobium leguminosarum]NKL63279.1 hypothetical protein [Rhizobium leguminosarum bv. viciae]